MTTPKLNNAVIEAAIAGFELQKAQIDSQISELRSMLTGSVSSAAPAAHGSPTKRSKFSPETLRRMREAQQRRWAKIKGGQTTAPAKKAAAKPASKPKRKLSAAGRKNIIDALKRRYAAKKAAEAAAKPAKKAS